MRILSLLCLLFLGGCNAMTAAIVKGGNYGWPDYEDDKIIRTD